MENKNKIILVEDDPGDRKLVKMIINELLTEDQIELIILKDGSEALSFFEGINEFDNEMLVIMDINLPLISGHELLKYITSNKFCKHCFTVMLTTSNSQNDINIAFENNASGYFRKPSTIDQLENTIKTIINYWLLTYKHN